MYNRQKAVEYAHKWWNGRNPAFYNFDDLGGDCTNFVSQCLFFGGIAMNYNTLGWFYNNLNFRSPSWTGVDEFYNFSINNTSNFGVKSEQVSIEQIDLGDVVQLKLFDETEFHHSMIVTGILSNNSVFDILVTSHSFDAKDKSLGSYNAKEIRFLKILN